MLPANASSICSSNSGTEGSQSRRGRKITFSTSAGSRVLQSASACAAATRVSVQISATDRPMWTQEIREWIGTRLQNLRRRCRRRFPVDQRPSRTQRLGLRPQQFGIDAGRRAPRIHAAPEDRRATSARAAASASRSRRSDRETQDSWQMANRTADSLQRPVARSVASACRRTAPASPGRSVSVPRSGWPEHRPAAGSPALRRRSSTNAASSARSIFARRPSAIWPISDGTSFGSSRKSQRLPPAPRRRGVGGAGSDQQAQRQDIAARRHRGRRSAQHRHESLRTAPRHWNMTR